MSNETTETGDEKRDYLQEAGSWLGGMGGKVGDWFKGDGWKTPATWLGTIAATGLAYMMGKNLFGKGPLGMIFGVGLALVVGMFSIGGISKLLGTTARQGDEAPDAPQNSPFAEAASKSNAVSIEANGEYQGKEGREMFIIQSTATNDTSNPITLTGINPGEMDSILIADYKGDLTGKNAVDILTELNIDIQGLDGTNVHAQTLPGRNESAGEEIHITFG